MEDVIVTDPELTENSAESTISAELVDVVDVQFRSGQKIYYFAPGEFHLEPGSRVIIDTARGPEFGTCTSGIHKIPQNEVVSPLREVIRIASDHDERILAENQDREKKAFEICRQKIEYFGLDMQLVSAECAFDGSKILFFFTADERVDFRELVKSLASAFHTRIELRQIGVRDKAKMVGGLGICGRPFCCATFLDDFQPVSIKMAKTQNLSLNPTKISGTCGRLMCCLKYEQEAYEALLKTVPKAESFVDTPEGRGTVVDVNLLRQQVRVRMETQTDTISTFSVSDIAVLRNGKAKKTDPPIPEDLAPISGNGKLHKKPEQDDQEPVLDPIRFRYRTESVVDEAEQPEPDEEEKNNPPRHKKPQEGESRPPRADHRRKQPRPSRSPRGDRPQKAEQKPSQDSVQKADAPDSLPKEVTLNGEPKTVRKPRRRSNYHHPRKPRPQGDRKPEDKKSE